MILPFYFVLVRPWNAVSSSGVLSERQGSVEVGSEERHKNDQKDETLLEKKAERVQAVQLGIKLW